MRTLRSPPLFRFAIESGRAEGAVRPAAAAVRGSAMAAVLLVVIDAAGAGDVKSGDDCVVLVVVDRGGGVRGRPPLGARGGIRGFARTVAALLLLLLLEIV